MIHKGSSWELGRPCRFHRARRLEIPPTNSHSIHGSASGAGGDEPRDATMVSPSEGNESRRNGRAGSRSTSEYRGSGGNQPQGPRRGKGVPSMSR